MQILRASEGMEAALDILARGGTVIHATETCYGIACDLTNPEAVGKLFRTKKRPADQPVSALFSSAEASSAYVEYSPRALSLAEKYLPGPLTLVLPKKGTSPLHITASGGGNDPLIGVRVSSHPLAAELARRFGKPIATTSANLHGAENPYSLADLRAQFGDAGTHPDLILDSGTLPPAPPSTVVQILGETVTVLRAGNIVI